LFFALAKERRFKRAVLSDANGELVRTWLAIQRNHVGVLRELDKHKHTEAAFYRVRDQDWRMLSDEKCAARMIYLNRTGFNGLYRVNAAGKFNVPFGKQAKMLIFIDPDVIRRCADVLNAANVTIVNLDFEDATRKVRLGDFAYFDPPYAPLSRTSSFTAYQAGGFGTDDQQRLAALARRLDAGGRAALFSNSNCDLVDRLYAGMDIERIMAKRAINSKADARGEIREVLVKTSALSTMHVLAKAGA